MTEEDRDKIERVKEHIEKWTELAAEMSQAGAAADGDALLRASSELAGALGETVNLMRELGSDQESDQAGLTDVDAQDMFASLDRAGREFAAFRLARRGEVVATAEFDPGIAPFTIEVRRVPVPVTNSKHFIVSLYRGEYVVTSFRYFWPNYTPERVCVSWPCISQFTVTFDDMYEASCHWRWGAGATWSMTVPEGSQKSGLSPYFFTPRNPPPPGCPEIPLE